MLTKEQLENLHLSSDKEKQAQFPRSDDPNKDDEWIPSFCGMCYSACPLRVHRVDGVVVKVEGNPTANTDGRLCPKGSAGIMRLYDPHRIRTPLKRTNPHKGIGIDPGWEEISWEEAYEIITRKLRTIREKDPRRLMIGSFDMQRVLPIAEWCKAFGCTIIAGGIAAGPACGNGEHVWGEMVHGSFIEAVDLEHTRMLMLVGTGAGHESYACLGTDAKRMADARLRGMNMVVVDPRMSAAAAKANEWVPIRPGTDAALTLGMVNVLLNELAVYDASFIKHHTNGPYLIGPDGYYVRDPESGKPIVWDHIQGAAKPYDDPSVQDYALQGVYHARGVECRPGFQVLKDHVRAYTPERVEEITTVSKDTVRRLATQWAEAASIGSTITIGGREYPYRPVAILFYRGTQGHKHAMLEAMAHLLLPLIVGAMDVPGGHVRFDVVMATIPTFPTNRQAVPGLPAGADGMIPSTMGIFGPPMPVGFPPRQLDLREYFPLGGVVTSTCLFSVLEPERYGFTDDEFVFLFNHVNSMMSLGDPPLVERALQKSYVINCNIVHDETTELSDLIIPEATFLERYNITGSWSADYFGIQASFPALKEPLYGLPQLVDILLEVADRLNILKGEQGVNWWFNTDCRLQESYALEVNQRYTWPEIMDRILQSHNDSPQYNLDWFRRHGHRIRRAAPEEKYLIYHHSRLPLYALSVKEAGGTLRREMERFHVAEKMNLVWDYSDYQPLPDWKPGPIHCAPSEYDLFAVSFKTVLFTFSCGAFNPYLMEVAEKDPYLMKAWMNPIAARPRGLKEGDPIWIESPVHRIQGVLTVSESIHPECVGIGGTLGHWADNAIAKGKGMHFNALNPVNWEWTDFVSVAMESVTAPVKVYKMR